MADPTGELKGGPLKRDFDRRCCGARLCDPLRWRIAGLSHRQQLAIEAGDDRIPANG
jgi:hypothetical protein